MELQEVRRELEELRGKLPQEAKARAREGELREHFRAKAKAAEEEFARAKATAEAEAKKGFNAEELAKERGMELDQARRELEDLRIKLPEETAKAKAAEEELARAKLAAEAEAKLAEEAAARAREELENLQRNCAQAHARLHESHEDVARESARASKLHAQTNELLRTIYDLKQGKQGLGVLDPCGERLTPQELASSLKKITEQLDKERLRSRNLERLLNQREFQTALRASFGTAHDVECSKSLHCHARPPRDEVVLDTLGEMLLRKIQTAPEHSRQNMKKQLLLCFHPDKNPITEVAMRMTQLLNDTCP